MNGFQGKVAVVTGAGSGIGRALALELYRRGARLAVSDIDADGLVETLELLADTGGLVHESRLDVSDREAVESYAHNVIRQFGVVHQVYNNAGIASGRTILDSPYEIYDRVLGVNLWGVIHGTKAFLPHLIDSGDGHVINISSLNGYVAQGELSAYCTSKFGVRGFTESLRVEMLRGRHRVKVTCVHPGGIKTNIARAGLRHAEELGLEVGDRDRKLAELYSNKLLRMDPARCASIVLDAVEAGKPRVRVGNDAVLTDWVVRLAPKAYPRLIAGLERLAVGR